MINMTKHMRKKLIEEYPYLQPRNIFTNEISKDYDYQFIHGEYDLPDGWLELFLQMCEDIKEPLIKVDYLDKFRFLQIKEKYGSMRVYTYGATNEVLDIIRKYEFLSAMVCCVCGKPANIRTYGYICPYCYEHIKDSYENVEDCEVIEVVTTFTKEIWGPDGCVKTDIDCSDEWSRYLARINYAEV